MSRANIVAARAVCPRASSELRAASLQEHHFSRGMGIAHAREISDAGVEGFALGSTVAERREVCLHTGQRALSLEDEAGDGLTDLVFHKFISFVVRYPPGHPV